MGKGNGEKERVRGCGRECKAEKSKREGKRVCIFANVHVCVEEGEGNCKGVKR